MVGINLVCAQPLNSETSFHFFIGFLVIYKKNGEKQLYFLYDCLTNIVLIAKLLV